MQTSEGVFSLKDSMAKLALILGSILFLASFISYSECQRCADYKFSLKDDGKASGEQKAFLNCWGKDVQSGESDTIILMDTSGSMGTSGFNGEVQFVNSLLTRVKVAYNATRIVIGTFDTQARININYLQRPSYGNHKCKFKKDFSTIRFTGGMTNIKGTLQQAGNIFSELAKNDPRDNYRKTSNKVIIVISDGYGNMVGDKVDWNAGGDVTAEMNNIRAASRQIEVYTVALTKWSDTNTLQNKIATTPELYMFQPNFNTLDALAKNIRGDPYEHDYETEQVSDTECGNKCDGNANCGCNLITGNFRCRCRRGYYGSGAKESTATCHKCPADTYAASEGLLKVTDCTKCMTNGITNGPGKLSSKDCYCKTGYKLDGATSQCVRKKCPPAPPIKDGTITNSAVCSKYEYETTCVYQCNANFELSGSDVLKCEANEQWSPPTAPSCSIILCPITFSTADPKYTVSCTTDNVKGTHYTVNTVCTFACKGEYYQHGGDAKRTCQGNKQWTGSQIDCRTIQCPKIPIVTPESNKVSAVTASSDCFKNELGVDATCRFQCPFGYDFKGPTIILCQKDGNKAKGKWSGNVDTNPPICSDVTPPAFAKGSECAQGQVKKIETCLPGKPYANVNFASIGVTDNSGEVPTVFSEPPEFEFGKTYALNWTSQLGRYIKFTAQDKAGNKQTCSYNIVVLDKEPPKNTKCPGNIVKKTSATEATVTWENPTYTDNCGNYRDCPIQIPTPAARNGAKYQLGTPVVVNYTAIDPSDNRNTDCKFSISVLPNTCGYATPPTNGALAKHGTILVPFCQTGLYPATPWPAVLFFICKGTTWANPITSLGPETLAGCTENSPPNGQTASTYAFNSFTGDCNDPAVKNQIRDKYALLIGCNAPCTKDKIEVYCGATTVVLRRKRRATSEVTVKITLKVTGDDTQATKDPNGNLANLKKEMETVILPKAKADLEAAGDLSTKVLPGLQKTKVTTDAAKEVCKYEGEIAQANPDILRKCFGCPAGEFKNLTTGKCQECPSGSKQPLYKQVSCQPCPAGEDTQGKDKGSHTSCKTYCQPGQYSPNGLEPCYTCPSGTYSDQHSTKVCTKCPANTVTVLEGAKSINDCGSECQPGTYSDNGVEPCTPCPRGLYSDSPAQVICKSCPGIQSTFGIGSNSLSHCKEINYCASNPCVNGKNCINYKDTFYCECQKGFYGTRCEKEVNECALKPCLHGGKCIDEFNDYSCRCPPNTNGKHCETIVDLCDNSLCGANGHCNVLADSKISCTCNDGYTGQFCEGRISPCHSSPCRNKGQCIDDGKGNFQCKCPSGYAGKECQTKLPACGPKPCQNNGQCQEGTNGFICTCPPGYGGLHCENQYDMCLHTPCQNGGTCTGLVNDVTCLCAPGFGGKHCQTKLKLDYDISFQTRLGSTFGSVPGRHDLSAFTIALWMRTADLENVGTPISYATAADDNALVLTNYQNFDLTINNVTESLDFKANDGEWHHILVTWASSTGNFQAYKDGVAVKSGVLQQGKTIKKGGIFVVGEEQDSLGGGFSSTESFFGDMTQLNIWNRVLTANEIYDLTTSCKHTQGNTVAWADFYDQRFEGMYVTEPSLGCDFYNSFREFQYLKRSDLPDGHKTASQKATQSGASAKACADVCKSSKFRYWCRSFTFSESLKQCKFYSRSLLTHPGEPKDDVSLDLFQLSCVKDLGLATGAIADSQITASSYQGTALPSKGRLFNVAAKADVDKTRYWTAKDGASNSYIEVNLGRVYRVTGIGTQGHSNPDVKEWVKEYRIQYKSGNSWVNYNHAKRRKRAWGIPNIKFPTIPKFTIPTIPKIPPIPVPVVPTTAPPPQVSAPTGHLFKANVDPSTVVRNGLYVETNAIRLFPVSWNGKVTLRMEIYGCKTTPQGMPDKKTDANQCAANPCRNGGTCYDLYTRYVCVCPQGFSGENCQSAASCGKSSVPLNGKVASQSATKVTFACNTHWTLSGPSSQSCVKGTWTGTLPTCVDTDECKTGYCSHQCENLVGGVRCLCPAGYLLGHDGKTCVDVNECASFNGGCNDVCENTVGGFNCKCSKPGRKSILKFTCVDVDECSGNHGCSTRCENTLGSFKCACDDGFILSGDKKTCNHVQCPTLSNVANGKFSIQNGVTATYTCNAGFQITGSPVRTCLPTKKWSGATPSCTPVKCVPLSNAASTIRLTYSSNAYNAKASFTCVSPLTLVGSSQITCQQSGQWSGDYPRCLKTNCPALTSDKVINGKFVGMATNLDAVVRVMCNKGYTLREASLAYRTCQASKEWTGGNNAVAHCDIVDCKQPVKHGAVMNIVLHGGTTYGARATYSCSQSSGQHCVNGPITRTCESNGKWSGIEPACVANACCTPPVPENSKVYWKGAITYGSLVLVLCNKGYNPGGTDYRKCENTGKWSGTDPTCTITDCKDPGSPANGIRFGTKTTYQSKFRFFCNPGYALSGSRERVCQADGKWTGTQPKCIGSLCTWNAEGEGNPSILLQSTEKEEQEEKKAWILSDLDYSKGDYCAAYWKRYGAEITFSAGCGGKILKKSGEVTLGGGTNVCHWLIQVTQGKKVTIEWPKYDLKGEETMQLFDVKGENDEASYDPFLTFGASKPRPVTSNLHFMRVVYNGAKTHGTGFTFKFSENTCGGMYTQKGAEITSPGYPVGYANNLNCYWTVHRPYDKLEITFRDYKLPTFLKDYTELYEGPVENAKLLLYRANGKLTPVISEPFASRFIWMHFFSDDIYTSKGFYMYYRVFVPREA